MTSPNDLFDASHHRGLRVVVTGTTGAIGGNLVRALTRLDVAHVLALDDRAGGPPADTSRTHNRIP